MTDQFELSPLQGGARGFKRSGATKDVKHVAEIMFRIRAAIMFEAVNHATLRPDIGIEGFVK